MIAIASLPTAPATPTTLATLLGPTAVLAAVATLAILGVLVVGLALERRERHVLRRGVVPRGPARRPAFTDRAA